MEEQLLLYLEYHPQVSWYGRGAISATFASTYKIASPLPIPFPIDYLFESKAHVYLPDAIGQLLDGRLLIAEAGREQEKRRERTRAKAEAARKVARTAGRSLLDWNGGQPCPKRGTRIWSFCMLGVRRFLPGHSLKRRGLVIWPWGEAACVQELVERLGERWPQAEREAAIWKRCAESAARGHLLVDLASVSLTRLTPLICLSSDAPPILPDPLPSELSDSMTVLPEAEEEDGDQHVSLLSTFDDSTLQSPVREHFLRTLRAVEQVLAGASIVETARETQIARSTLSRLVQRTRKLGVLACVSHATYSRERELHPVFQEVIRRLYLLPTKLSMTAIAEHAELKRAAKRVQEDTGTAIPLPTYEQIRGLRASPQTGTPGTPSARTSAGVSS